MIKYNKFEKKLLEELNIYGIPEKGKSVLVGVSGGADSVSLLVSLTRIHNAYPLNIYVFHLNHQLRGEEAKEDMRFVEALCKNLSVPFYSESFDVNLYAQNNKIGIEEAAREIRYKFFREFSDNNQIDYILTAHNKNDVAETILFHVVRGCGVSGLIGINRQRDNIIRPLLNFNREEIENYCSELSLSYVTDSTNSDIHYDRNYIRHIILPSLKKLNPSIVDTLKRLSDSAVAVNNSLEIYEHFCDNILSKDLDDEMLFRRAKERFYKLSNQQLTSNRINALKKALQCDAEKVISFPDDIECVVKNGDFFFRTKRNIKNSIVESELIYGENYINDDLVIEITRDRISNDYIKYDHSALFVINGNAVKGTLKVRSRNEGDKLKIGNMTKSIKKQFIDKKIPREYRDLIPIIIDDNDILLVPGIGIADKVKSIGTNDIYIGIHSKKGYFI